jgi:signal transduction histidine kinase
VDAAVAAAVQILISIPFLVSFPAGEGPTPLAYLLATGTAVPLEWRRRYPLGVLLLVTAFQIPVTLYHRPGQPMPYGAVVAVYTIFALGPRWQRRALGPLLYVTIVVVDALRNRLGAGTLVTIGYFTGACVLGALARIRQAYTATVEERALRLERERDLEAKRADAEARRAAAEERARIARDMHDILAHAVSLMVVQAEAGPVVMRTDPARAEASFDAIATAGRDAMVQLRRILGTLKEGDAAAERAPQPTLAGLADLVARVRAAGLPVSYERAGEPRPVPPDVEAAAYRVVQEALTNTVKHAAAGSAAVRVEWQVDELSVTVTDDGRGPAAGAVSGGGGHGFVGIRERAAACGGTAEIGPGPGGRGFRVALRLPLRPPVAAADQVA